MGVSIAGIIVSIQVGCSEHGGRGGAVGVAIAFGTLFIRRATALKLVKKKLGQIEDLPASLKQLELSNSFSEKKIRRESLERIIKEYEEAIVGIHGYARDLRRANIRIRGAIRSDLDWNRIETRYLVFASFFSTIIWGFGDLIAKHLMP